MNDEPKIAEIGPVRLIGMSMTTTVAGGRIKELWQRFKPRVGEIPHRTDDRFYSVQTYDPAISYDTFTPHTPFQRWAAVEVSEAPEVPEGMQERILAGGLYAVFIHTGPVSAFRHTLEHIHRKWLPGSGYVLDKRDNFEILGKEYYGPLHPDSKEEVWIPVKKNRS